MCFRFEYCLTVAHPEIAEKHAIIRKVEADLNSTIGILADLQGPKLRVGVCLLLKKAKCW